MKSRKQYLPALSSLSVEFDREEDGRWIAEIPNLRGVMAYGATKREALQRVYAIALNGVHRKLRCLLGQTMFAALVKECWAAILPGSPNMQEANRRYLVLLTFRLQFLLPSSK